MAFVTVKPAARSRYTARAPFNDLGQVFNSLRAAAPTAPVFRPAVNVMEHERQFTLQVAAPGLERKDFELSVEKGVLQIVAQRDASTAEGCTLHRQGFGAYQLKRSFRLGKEIDEANITAVYEQGILTVSLPKTAAAQPKPARKIAIG
ncbi:Hsp20/alpha crystallin family protein [Phaeodactylibacter luteus]|uniref:Hsp20/alpha crystallin family protein n=1 Tax=Phaeodactylibacter luteus TaxID=1564516 RepID=A0A5C6RJP5_9BACT|nr:Hsp20/alpha crystallin family protein [Phaeodactylibacter luteus]TXB62164.1 Hsp20/alpha crystallin family protein [Phaeodactylibacter luteus]